MSLITSTLRQGYFSPYMMIGLRRPRPKVSPRTIQKKKEAKRMKLVNKFSVENSGEKPLHSWMDAKKLKALAATYQEMRNHHRMSMKIDPKDSAEYLSKSESYSLAFYKKWKEQQIQGQQYHNNQTKVYSYINKLPFQLREELEEAFNPGKIVIGIPEEYLFLNLYYEQLMRILPDEWAERIQLGMRLNSIASDSLGLGE